MRDFGCKSQDLDKASEIIKDGGIVVYPTDTVYGLGALAFEPDDVAALYEAKERLPDKAIAVL